MKLFFLMFIGVMVSAVYSQTLYTVNSTASGQTGDDATKTGTLEWCMNKIAYNDNGTDFKIVFDLPGSGVRTINVANSMSMYPGGSKTILIDGASVSGFDSLTNCGAPLVVLKGLKANNGFEFGNTMNVTIKSLCFQNFKNAIVTNTENVSLNVYGCNIGTESDGSKSATSTIAECGIRLNKGNDVNIGGFGNCQQNIIMNCGATDYQTQHGISINGAVASLKIINNVISANRGCGILCSGNNGNGVIIKGNKIGVDKTGLIAEGNGTTGIRFENGSKNIVIGGPDLNDRNIISANGLNTVPNSSTYNGEGPTIFEWSNMTGIYFKGVTNSTIENNLIGTDITGNSTGINNSFGNFNSGIKIEQGSSGTIFTKNIIGGNGFRSAAQALLTPPTGVKAGQTYKGHGVLVKDIGTSDCEFKGNYVGLGVDGISKIGNKQDGLSIQGATKLTVGGSTADSRNYFADNIYGVFVSSDYDNDLSSNIFIYGNYIGTDTSGKIAVPNGKNGEGAGVGHRDNCDNIFVGGVLAGQSNLISGNLNGIYSTLDGAAVTTKVVASANKLIVKNNVIGTLTDGATALPNTNVGVLLEKGTTKHLIGGSAANEGNIISGNKSYGISLNNSPANTISGNKIGVTTDGTTKLSNGADGIRIANNSDNNLIGGLTIAAGNIIANNPGNGINILDAASVGNTIRNNSITCNSLRGIELNSLANEFATFLAPTFTGTKQNIVITGPTGSWIELFVIDSTCANCSAGLTSKKLEGKTLVKAGLSPLTYAPSDTNLVFTATATKGGSATVSGTSTSEFSGCYVLCTPPDVSKQVVSSNSPLCSGSSGIISVTNTEPNVTYNAYIDSKLISTVVGNGLTVNMTVTKDKLNFIGTKTVTVKATPLNNCITLNLADTTSFKVNPIEDSTRRVTVQTPICENTSSLITIPNSTSEMLYKAYIGTELIGSKIGDGKTVSFSSKVLAAGNYKVNLTAEIAGCNLVKIDSIIDLKVNKTPDVNLLVDYKSVNCSDAGNSIITVKKSDLGVFYNVLENNISIKSAIGTGSDLPIDLGVLSIGNHSYKIAISIAGCGDKNLLTEPQIVVNKKPNTDSLVLKASKLNLCENDLLSELSVGKTRGVSYTYTLKNNGVVIDSLKGNNATVLFNNLKLNLGANVFSVVESVASCSSSESKTLTINVDSLINTKSPKLSALNSVSCTNEPQIVTLTNGQKGVLYYLFDNNKLIDSVLITVPNFKKDFGPYSLSTGKHSFSLKAKSIGCDLVDVESKTEIEISTQPNVSNIEVTTSKAIYCKNNTALVVVKPTKSNTYTYVALDNGVEFGRKVGNNGTLEFVMTDLLVGNHSVKIIEEIVGCDSDTTIPVNFFVDSLINTTRPVLGGTPNITCSDSLVELVLSKVQSNVNYTLKDNGVVQESKSTSTNLGTIRFNKLKLASGIHYFSITASSTSCDSITLASKDTILINKRPSADLIVTNNSPICINTMAQLDIKGTETGVIYSIYSSLSNPDSLLGKANNGKFSTGVYNKMGTDSLYVVAQVEGCSDTELNTKQVITINKFDGNNLNSAGSTVCYSNTAQVALYNTSSKWTYSASIGDSVVLVKGGGDLIFTLPKNYIAKGLNKVVFKEIVPGCGVDTVAVDTVYSIGDVSRLSGSVYVCENSTSTYVVDKIAGATNYKFSWPSGADSVLQTNNQIVIKWGDTSTSGVVKVVPNVTIGTCDNLYSQLYVNVSVPYSGRANFINEDTVCVGMIDTVGIDELIGVSYDTLERSPSIEYIDTLYYVNGYTKYVIRYLNVGTVAHHYTIYNPCDGFKDTTQFVEVLPYPKVSAGLYPVIEMMYFPKEVVLDGSNSSKSDSRYKYIYQWFTKPYNNVNNSQSIIASFVPQETKQTVYLTVANAHKGMCSVTDSAIIVVDLGIFIPNVFTPNSDGDHDTWNLENINAFYPNAEIDIYSKWGTKVFSTKSYTKPWDGTRNGEELPSATYYYVIDLKKSGFKPVAGSVTIIR